MKKKIGALALAFLIVLSSPAAFFAIKSEAADSMPTIAETFPDPNLAQRVAEALSVDVTAELTQTMIDGLTRLDGNYAEISNVTGIEKLTALTELVLSGNRLTSLPDNIGNLDKLQYLYIDDNQLTSLPESIGNLSSLKELSLWVNKLTYLPESISNLSTLIYLDIEENGLTNLPTNIANLTSLEILYIGWNMFPEDYRNQLIDAGMNGGIIHDGIGSGQYRLALKPDLGPFTITHGSNLDDMNLESLLELPLLPDYDFMTPQPATQTNGHNLILDNYVDENQEPVSLEDYLKNGVVQKNGTVFAQVRATAPGIFSGENINAITEGTIELNFQTTNYELSFDLNGVTGTTPETQSLLEDEVGTKVTLEYEAEEGLIFKGWNREQDGSGDYWEPGITPMIGENVTLYAIWTKMGPPPYISLIHFDANGGTGTMEDQHCFSGNVGKLSKNTFIREEYTFIGWSTTPKGEVTCLDEAIDPFTAKENITLYAQWKANNQEVAPIETNKPPSTTPGNTTLPATGGYSLILIGMLLIGIGSVVVFKRVVKNKE